jgi:hypothetical protein
LEPDTLDRVSNPDADLKLRAMMMFATRSAIRISDPNPFGEVTLAPATLSGRSESQMARAMAEALVDSNPGTASQALRYLRAMFPDSPLTTRVAALNALMRR